ncbi:hypothetical protein K501DRAFT_233824 [Backusella circina FSU 941]|nr:hypothetical protein K501DRAFT_233824 [Backusella circina FSU 941]
MKVESLLLGHFIQGANREPFQVFRLKDHSLLFQWTDVCSFFNLPDIQVQSLSHQLGSKSNTLFRDDQDRIYISALALISTAVKHNKFLLAELCKLKPTDYAANLADAILDALPQFERNAEKSGTQEFNQVHHIELSPLTPSMVHVKPEPVSPPKLPIRQSDPMALDSMLTTSTRKQSRPLDDPPHPNKKPRTDPDSLPNPVHTVSSQQAPPTLLAKRLSNKQNVSKNARNLTIYTPSYGEQYSVAVKSAPLHSNFRQVAQQQQSRQPHPLAQAATNQGSSRNGHLAPLISPRMMDKKAEFAIPPVVPSQQQPPHTAHHFPHSPLHPTSAYAHSFPNNRNLEVPTIPPQTPTTNSHAALKRQQFMQPFEHLFDTIETTRSLKSTLDDQIRRSSTLIQTLQASTTTIEGLVRNHVKEAHRDAVSKMDESLDRLLKRIGELEEKAGVSKEEVSLVSPPTIVKSQNDIGPQEYHAMLDTLRERLDRLERQLEP